MQVLWTIGKVCKEYAIFCYTASWHLLNFQNAASLFFLKYCRMHVCLQRSVPMQPKTSDICRNLPKIGNYPSVPQKRRYRPAPRGHRQVLGQDWQPRGDDRPVGEGVRRAERGWPGVDGYRMDASVILEGSFSAASTPIFAINYPLFLVQHLSRYMRFAYLRTDPNSKMSNGSSIL